MGRAGLDQTGEQHRQQALEANNARNESLDGVVVLDAVGGVVGFNEAAEQMFGLSRADILGRSFQDLLPSGSLDLATAGDTAGSLGRRLEATAVRADGVAFPVQIALVQLRLDGTASFTCFVRDLTKVMAADRALNEQLRDRAERVESAREEERTRIAREIHDELGQQLTAIQWISRGSRRG